MEASHEFGLSILHESSHLLFSHHAYFAEMMELLRRKVRRVWHLLPTSILHLSAHTMHSLLGQCTPLALYRHSSSCMPNAAHGPFLWCLADHRRAHMTLRCLTGYQLTMATSSCSTCYIPIVSIAAPLRLLAGRLHRLLHR